MDAFPAGYLEGNDLNFREEVSDLMGFLPPPLPQDTYHNDPPPPTQDTVLARRRTVKKFHGLRTTRQFRAYNQHHRDNARLVARIQEETNLFTQMKKAYKDYKENHRLYRSLQKKFTKAKDDKERDRAVCATMNKCLQESEELIESPPTPDLLEDMFPICSSSSNDSDSDVENRLENVELPVAGFEINASNTHPPTFQHEKIDVYFNPDPATSFNKPSSSHPPTVQRGKPEGYCNTAPVIDKPLQHVEQYHPLSNFKITPLQTVNRKITSFTKPTPKPKDAKAKPHSTASRRKKPCYKSKEYIDTSEDEFRQSLSKKIK